MKVSIKKTVLQIRLENPNYKVRFSFIGYRGNFNDSNNRKEIFDFSDDYNKFVEQLDTVNAFGGSSSGVEDVYGGFSSVLQRLSKYSYLNFGGVFCEFQSQNIK